MESHPHIYGLESHFTNKETGAHGNDPPSMRELVGDKDGAVTVVETVVLS